MPGNVAAAVASGVLPYALYSAITEELRLEALVNVYPDGSSDRAALAVNPRHFFKLSLALTPAQWNTFYQFFFNQRGKPFYFYNLRETVPPFTWDATGQNPVGRYLVVFDGPWSEDLQLARSRVSFNLREVA